MPFWVALTGLRIKDSNPDIPQASAALRAVAQLASACSSGPRSSSERPNATAQARRQLDAQLPPVRMVEQRWDRQLA